MYGRIPPSDSSEAEGRKHPTDLNGYKLHLTTILIINPTIVLMNLVVGPNDGFILEHIVSILSYNNFITEEPTAYY